MKIRIQRYKLEIGYEYYAECLKNKYDIITQTHGDTPEQAVANLFLKIITTPLPHFIQINYNSLDIVYNYDRDEKDTTKDDITEQLYTLIDEYIDFIKQQDKEQLERQLGTLLYLQKKQNLQSSIQLKDSDLEKLLESHEYLQELRIIVGKKAAIDGLNPTWKFVYEQLAYALDHLSMMIQRTDVKEL